MDWTNHKVNDEENTATSTTTINDAVDGLTKAFSSNKYPFKATPRVRESSQAHFLTLEYILMSTASPK